MPFALCLSLAMLSLSPWNLSIPRHGGDDVDAERSDAPDHYAEHDAESSATDGVLTARWDRASLAAAHPAGNAIHPYKETLEQEMGG